MDRVGGLSAEPIETMYLADLKEIFRKLSAHDLPAGAATLAGVILLFLIFKTSKLFIKLVFFFIAVGLFASAYWWRAHK